MPAERLQFEEKQFNETDLGNEINESKVDELRKKVDELYEKVKQLEDLAKRDADGKEIPQELAQRIEDIKELQKTLQKAKNLTIKEYEDTLHKYDEQLSLLADSYLQYNSSESDDISNIFENRNNPEKLAPATAIVPVEVDFLEQEFKLKKCEDIQLRDQDGKVAMTVKTNLFNRVFDAVSIKEAVNVSMPVPNKDDPTANYQNQETVFYKVSYAGRDWYIDEQYLVAQGRKHTENLYSDVNVEGEKPKNKKVFNEHLGLSLDTGKSALIDRVYKQIDSYESGKSSAQINKFKYTGENGTVNIDMTFDGEAVLLRKNGGDIERVDFENLNQDLNKILFEFLGLEASKEFVLSQFDKDSPIEQFPDIELRNFDSSSFGELTTLIDSSEKKPGSGIRAKYMIDENTPVYIAVRNHGDRMEYYISDNSLPASSNDEDKKIYARPKSKEEFLALLSPKLESPRLSDKQEINLPNDSKDKIAFRKVLNEKYPEILAALSTLQVNQPLVIPLPSFDERGANKYITIVKRGEDLYEFHSQGFEDDMASNGSFLRAKDIKQAIIDTVEMQEMIPEALRKRPEGLERKPREEVKKEELREPEEIAYISTEVLSDFHRIYTENSGLQHESLNKVFTSDKPEEIVTGIKEVFAKLKDFLQSNGFPEKVAELDKLITDIEAKLAGLSSDNPEDKADAEKFFKNLIKFPDLYEIFQGDLEELNPDLHSLLNIQSRLQGLEEGKFLNFQITVDGKTEFFLIKKLSETEFLFVNADNKNPVEMTELRIQREAKMPQILKTLHDFLPSDQQFQESSPQSTEALKIPRNAKGLTKFLNGPFKETFDRVEVDNYQDIMLPGNKRIRVFKRAKGQYELMDLAKLEEADCKGDKSTFEFKSFDELKVVIVQKYRENPSSKELNDSQYDQLIGYSNDVKSKFSFYEHPAIMLDGSANDSDLSKKYTEDTELKEGPDFLAKYTVKDIEAGYQYLKMSALDQISSFFKNAQNGHVTIGQLREVGIKEPEKFLGLFAKDLDPKKANELGGQLMIAALTGMKINGEGDSSANKEMFNDVWDFYGLDIQDKISATIADFTEKKGPIIVIADKTENSPGGEEQISEDFTNLDFKKFRRLALSDKRKDRNQTTEYVQEASPTEEEKESVPAPIIQKTSIYKESDETNQVILDKEYYLVRGNDGRMRLFESDANSKKWVLVAEEGEDGNERDLKRALKEIKKEADKSKKYLRKYNGGQTNLALKEEQAGREHAELMKKPAIKSIQLVDSFREIKKDKNNKVTVKYTLADGTTDTIDLKWRLEARGNVSGPLDTRGILVDLTPLMMKFKIPLEDINYKRNIEPQRVGGSDGYIRPVARFNYSCSTISLAGILPPQGKYKK